MAKEGDKTESEGKKPDPKRDYDEEKLKMRTDVEENNEVRK